MAIARTHRSIVRRASDVLVVFGAIALILNLVLALVVTPLVGAASVPPVVWGDDPEETGNPSCTTHLGYELGFKDDEWDKKSFPYSNDIDLDGDATSDLFWSSDDGVVLDWNSTVGIDAVIVKGGDDAHVYVYDPESFGDTGLTAPINPNNNLPHDISHVEWCYDEDPEPTPPPTVACPLQPAEGRIIINFPESWRLRSDEPSGLTTTAHPVSIPAGIYDIWLASYDDHEGDDPQPNEAWYLEALNGDSVIFFQSGAISDLPDQDNYIFEQVDNDEQVGQAIAGLIAHHASVTLDTSSPNSIRPVCAAFDPIPQDPGSITIIKDAVPDHEQDFAFSGDLGVFSLDDGGDATLSNTAVFSDLAPGSYAVGETVPADWALTDIACTGDDNLLIGADADFDPGDTGVTIDLDSGESVTCTFTNTADPASITVIKSDENDAIPGDWTFTINPDPTPAGSIGSGETFADLTPGTYVISEFGPDGWVFESVDCGDESHPTTVILGPNEEAVCTYTNIFDPEATPTPIPTATPVPPGPTPTPTPLPPAPTPTSEVLGVVVLPGTGFGPPSPVTLSFGLRMLGSALMILTGVGLRRLGR